MFFVFFVFFYLEAAVFETIVAKGFFWPLNQTACTPQGRKRVGIRAMLIQLDLRLLLANVWSQEKEMEKMGQGEIRD